MKENGRKSRSNALRATLNPNSQNNNISDLDLYKKHKAEYGTRLMTEDLTSPEEIMLLNEGSPTTLRSKGKSFTENDEKDSMRKVVINNLEEDNLDPPKLKKELQFIGKKKASPQYQVLENKERSLDPIERHRRKTSLLKAIGEPVPLPYLQNGPNNYVNVKNEESQRFDQTEMDSIDQRWNSVIESNRKIVKARLNEIRNAGKGIRLDSPQPRRVSEENVQGHSHNILEQSEKSNVSLKSEGHQDMYASFDDGYGDSIVIGTPKQDLIKSKRLDDAKVLSDIKSILLENSTKLDTVIEVLGSSKKVKLDKNNKIALNRLDKYSMNQANVKNTTFHSMTSVSYNLSPYCSTGTTFRKQPLYRIWETESSTSADLSQKLNYMFPKLGLSESQTSLKDKDVTKDVVCQDIHWSVDATSLVTINSDYGIRQYLIPDPKSDQTLLNPYSRIFAHESVLSSDISPRYSLYEDDSFSDNQVRYCGSYKNQVFIIDLRGKTLQLLNNLQGNGARGCYQIINSDNGSYLYVLQRYSSRIEILDHRRPDRPVNHLELPGRSDFQKLKACYNGSFQVGSPLGKGQILSWDKSTIESGGITRENQVVQCQPDILYNVPQCKSMRINIIKTSSDATAISYSGDTAGIALLQR
ncbi:Protein SWT21 [Nakaseomyces glabratus]|uniref:Protein SWT21 n=1 Tax=Candida glabrata TaxID=5478 RepID=A0A0W0DED8_CANGB|nr:Protein SWT21 [Nakaseomyces glabratus]